MRQIKDRFKIKKMKKESKTKRRIKNRMFPILLSLLIVSITCCATTQAYFNSKTSLIEAFGLLGQNSNLDITNGNVQLSFTDNSQWTSSTSSITKGGDGTYIFPSIGSGDEFKYGPVELKSTSNLTTNIDLGIDFDFTAKQTSNGDIGSSEVEEEEDLKKFVPGFEVIVGDMDNFGYGFAQNENIGQNAFIDFNKATQLSTTNYYDVYKDWNNSQFDRKFGEIDYAPAATTYSRKYNGMSIFPSSNYDAKGTDRRMVNTGFYNYMKDSKYIINENKEANFYSGLDYGVAFGDISNGTTFDFSEEKRKKFYVDGACYYWMYFGNDRAVYDGFTERALKGYYGVWYGNTVDTKQNFEIASNNKSTIYRGDNNKFQYYVDWKNWIGLEQPHIVDGKDWRYIQKVEPLTFRYANIPKDDEINSLCIQMYIDDIQPKHESYSDPSSFSYVSLNKYSLKVSGDGGSNWIEIKNWSDVINTLSQSGPAGEMITLNMSDLDSIEKSNIISELRKGAGLSGNGLKLKIDDEEQARQLTGDYINKFAMVYGNYGISGDSYAIDFAKMTVNGNIDPTQESVTITGQVTELGTNKPIKGAKVYTSNTGEAITDDNGEFTIKAIKENKNITITATHGEYKDQSQTIRFNTDSTVKFELARRADPDKEKVNLAIIVDEYAKDINNTTLSNTSIADITDSEKSKLNAKAIELTQKTEQVNVNNDGDIVTSGGTKVIRTTRSYNNINIDEVKMQLAQCSIRVEPQRNYKIYYSIKLQEGANGLCTYKFNSSLKAKSTQENNSGWTVSGENVDKYNSKIDILGNTISYTTSDETGDSTTGGSTGETTLPEEEETSETILKNNTPGIYFQNSRWNTNSIKINLNGFDVATTKMNGINWYKANLNQNVPFGKQSEITVYDNNSNTSGNLYYFNTKKVFICTE